jgi:Fe-Mn family superoxide dismutase
MPHTLIPIPCKPWSLNGLSERLVVNHYENEYGTAVRTLNAIRDDLAQLDLSAMSAHQVRAIKNEELAALGSVHLHELYFATLGGDGAVTFTGGGAGSTMPQAIAGEIERHFGSFAAWRREFVALAKSLSHGSGWSILAYSRPDKRLVNHIAIDHSHALVDSTPLVALDMYEHAYQLDFGSNAAAYVDAFLRNINWTAVNERLVAALGGDGVRQGNSDADALPSVSVEELSGKLASHEHVEIIDARPKHYFSRVDDMMQGAVWRDPERVEEWSRVLEPDTPVVVYCAYGYAVGCGVTAALRDRGLDAKYLRGGVSAWYAAGGERALKPRVS